MSRQKRSLVIVSMTSTITFLKRGAGSVPSPLLSSMLRCCARLATGVACTCGMLTSCHRP